MQFRAQRDESQFNFLQLTQQSSDENTTFTAQNG